MSGASNEPTSRVTFEHVAGLLALRVLGSAFRHPAKWSCAIVVLDGLDGAEARVTSRGDFAAWARANDLPSVAHEALHRRTPRGCVLCFVTLDTADCGAGAGFIVIDLANASHGGVHPRRKEQHEHEDSNGTLGDARRAAGGGTRARGLRGSGRGRE